MSRLLAWISAVPGHFRGRMRSVGSAGFVAIAVVGLVVAMFLADGFRATTLDLENPGVWVTNGDKKLVGRFNTRAEEVDTVVQTDVSGLDVAQDGSQVVVYGGGRLETVDPRTGDLRGGGEDGDKAGGSGGADLPPDSVVQMAGGRYLVVLGGDKDAGSAWTGRAEELHDLVRVKPHVRGAAPGLVVLGRDGTVAAMARDGSLTLLAPSGDRSKVALTGLDDVPDHAQLTLVGDVPALLDQEAGRLYLPDADPVDVAGLGEGPALQLPGDHSDRVVVAASKGLGSVALTGDRPVLDVESTQAGGAIRPVHVNGCTYGAWAAGSASHMAVRCGSGGAVDEPLDGVSGQLRFRVNRSSVALNELESGDVWIRDGDRIKKVVTDWDASKVPDDGEEQDSDNPEQVVDLNDEQEPPVANPDTWGARRNRPSVVPVLDNDTDANGDVLTVELLEPVPAGVTVVQQGRAVQVIPDADAPSTISFQYVANDGTADSKPAAVTVDVVDKGNKAPIRREEVRQRDFDVVMGQPGAYDVLPDWRDPEGDPIVLSGATPEDPSAGATQTVPTGRLTFTATSGTPGTRNLTVEVSDVPPSGAPETGTDTLKVEVADGRENLAPTLQPDYAVGAAGTAITVYPLRNDTDPNGDPLRLLKVVLPDGTNGRPWPPTVPSPEVSVDDGRIVVRPDKSFRGSLIFKYQATDDFNKAVEALVRVDVVAEENRPPSAAVDLVLLPPDDSARSVDVLVNDFDPDGDVMMVTGVNGGAVAGVRHQLLEHRRLRISSDAGLATPVVLTYTVSDGVAEATGQVIVVKSPLAGANADPVTAPDSATVRAGDVISIPVLANDVDPDGDPLHVGPELAQGPGAGQGTAFVSGDVVRFVAPDTPGTVRLTYSVTDDPEEAAVRSWSSDDVVITVKAAEDNRRPTPRTLEARVLAGNTVKITIPLSGIDPDGDSVGLVAVTSTVTPKRGRVVQPLGSDSITYEAFPAAVADDGQRAAGGSDQFTYLVRDSRGQTAEGNVRLVVGVSSASNPPVADTNKVRLAPGDTALVPVMADDYDPDGDPIAFAPEPLGPVPDGVSAEVVGARVRVTAPGSVGPVLPIPYFITDGRSFPPSMGWIELTVDPDAPGLPPIARDDVAQLPADQRDVSRIRVDVTDNDEDPDGDPERFRVEVLGGGGTVTDDDQVEVAPGAEPRVVVYRITDEQELTATAVIRVPKKDDLADRPPELVKDLPTFEVHAGGDPMDIELAKVVVDPEGQPVRLTNGDRVHPAPDGAGQVDLNELPKGVIRITAPAGAVPGAAAVSFEATDAADANADNAVTLSIPYTVVAAPGAEPPPRMRPVAVTVGAGDEPVTVDLSTQLEPGSGSPDDIEFTVHRELLKTPGLEVSSTGSKVTIEATAKAPVGGSPVELPVEVARGDKASKGSVAIAIVPTTRPLPACADAEVPDASAGEASTVELACTNPFPDTELVFGPPTSTTAQVSATIDGSSLTVTPKKGFHGDAVIAYPVTDEVGRTVNGTARVTVRDVPSAPGAPVVVAEESERVVLRWTASDPNGAEILRYLVEAPELTRPFECAPTATTCIVTGLTNDRTYHFRVVAENEVGPSDPGPEAAARPDQKPEPPTNVKLTFDPTRLDGKLTATWTAAESKGSKVENYRIRISPPLDGQEPIELGNVTKLELDGLENGTAYTVSVQAVNRSIEGGSDWVMSNRELPATVPGRVGSPTAVPVDDPLGMRIDVSWNPPADDGGATITGYRVNVYRDGECRPGATPFKQLPVVAPNQAAGYRIDLGNKFDTFRVAVLAITRATDDQGNSAAGLAAFNCSAPVKAPSKPDPVGAVTPLANRDGSNVGLDGRLMLRFAVPGDGGSPIAGYEVSQDGGAFRLIGSGSTQVSGSQVTLTVGGLANGTPYSFRVRARNGTNHQGDPSPPTPPLSPYAPLGQPTYQVTGVDQGGVNFQIMPPPDNGRSPISVTPTQGPYRATGPCGSPVRFTITARDGAGQVASVDVERATAACPPPPSISIAWGSATSVAGCTSGCRRMTAEAWNFPPNKRVSVTCEVRTSSGAAWNSNFGWDPPDLTTDASGHAATGDNGNNCVGSPSSAWEYRYVIDGIASPPFG